MLAELAQNWLEELSATFPIGAVPKLEWRPYRTTAGVAIYQTRTIALSKSLLQTPEDLRETLIHEYAHLLAFHRAGRKGMGHGKVWRQAMMDLGETPTVRHGLECKRNQRRQVVTYLCARCGAKIERARRLPKRRHFVHRSCGGFVQLLAVERL